MKIAVYFLILAVGIMQKNKILLLCTTALTICASFVFMIGIWAIDIGTSAIGLEHIIPVKVVTLLDERDPADHYHIGLVMAMLAFVFVVIYLNFVVILRL